MPVPKHATVVVIGSGFGGTMCALAIAREFDAWNAAHPEAQRTVVMLERGTWWTTPVSTVQDKEVATFDFLRAHKQPVQFWSSQNHFGGFIDIVTRCFKRGSNAHGLFELQRLGSTGFWSLFRWANDGLSVARASGVGGGSLVYSNITMRPPELIFRDERWKAVQWQLKDRDRFYELARTAIGRGLLFALDKDQGVAAPKPGVNTGLSNIVTRSGGLTPHWDEVPDPRNPSRPLKQIHPNHTVPGPNGGVPRDPSNKFWLDRARVFQTAIGTLTREFGAVDLAINDFDPANPGNQYDAANGAAKNYCERQSRCNVGCLPGARHTLNKQLMRAALGDALNPAARPFYPHLLITPLATVDVIEARPGGGYAVHYDLENPEAFQSGKRRRTTRHTITGDIVIVAAGCLGTNELMLRSRERRTLPHLSDQVGVGFSPNGDFIAFLEKTKETVNLVRGPVTTSFGHFETNDDPSNAAPHPRFHTIEDQGIPPALASLIGLGLPLLRSLGKGRNRFVFLLLAITLWLAKKGWQLVQAPFRNRFKRQETFRSSEEIAAKLMCIVAQGRDEANGVFRLGTAPGDTPLRVRKVRNGKEVKFHHDPVYKDIEATLDKLAPLLRADGSKARFRNPFLTKVFVRTKVDSIATSHPLGGCRIADSAKRGVVDEFGRVFDTSKTGARPYYEGLFIADGSILPTALGVNPSLTITALALRIVDHMIAEFPNLLAAPAAKAGPGPTTPPSAPAATPR